MSVSRMLSEAFCHFCGQVNPGGTVYVQKGQWSYLRCRDCKLVFLHLVADEEALQSHH